MSRRRSLLVIAALLAGSLSLPAAATAAPHDRGADPVVLTGAQVPALAGAAADRIVAFAWTGSAWSQIPVQVDQRKVIDLRSAYPATWSCGSNPQSYCYGPFSTNPTTVYADPGTLVGADPDPAVDGDDEIVTMAADLGGQVDAAPDPPGVVAGSRVEVPVRDPLDGGQAYVSFFTSDGSLDPGAGRHDVAYTFALASGDYLSTYKFAAGTNTETSTVVTPSYARAFTDRWQESELRITRGAATGVDILDRNDNHFAPNNCGRSSLTFSKGEGTFLTNRVGPLRAIRAFLGANSGPMTERQQVFYADREDDTVWLRVHPIPGIMSFLDYSAAAIGMTYANNLNPGGVTIDGVPDSPTPGPLTWETVDGPQGALTSVSQLDTNVPAASITSYYRDETSPGVAPCQGDGSYYGASGLWINGAIGLTDFKAPPVHLTATRTMYFDAPGQGDGPARRAQATSPLEGPPAPPPPTEPPVTEPITTPVTTPVTPPATRPSNRFTVKVAKRQRRGRLTVAVTVPGAGRLTGTLKAGRTTVGTAAATARRAGTRTLAVTVTRAGRRLAARHRGRLSVRLAVRFAPTGGTPRTITLAARTIRPGMS